MVMTLQYDIQSKIDALPSEQRDTLNVLLNIISEQSRDRYSNHEIEQRVESAIHKVLGEQINGN